jgi:hypothetical protein
LPHKITFISFRFAMSYDVFDMCMVRCVLICFEVYDVDYKCCEECVRKGRFECGKVRMWILRDILMIVLVYGLC